MRLPGYAKDWQGLHRVRLVRLLRGFAEGAVIDAVPLSCAERVGSISSIRTIFHFEFHFLGSGATGYAHFASHHAIHARNVNDDCNYRTRIA